MIAERCAGVRLTPELLAPVPARAILTRTLANLRASYMRRRRLADALWTVELALIVEPGEGRMLREAVRLLAATGRYEEAQTAAEALLAGDPDDLARADLEDQLTALAELRGRVN
jgi:regulator of sirC expression with transglutaminase-like and TPR domain